MNRPFIDRGVSIGIALAVIWAARYRAPPFWSHLFTAVVLTALAGMAAYSFLKSVRSGVLDLRGHYVRSVAPHPYFFGLAALGLVGLISALGAAYFTMRAVGL
jgi:hypothetical protein